MDVKDEQRPGSGWMSEDEPAGETMRFTQKCRFLVSEQTTEPHLAIFWVFRYVFIDCNGRGEFLVELVKCLSKKSEFELCSF